MDSGGRGLVNDDWTATCGLLTRECREARAADADADRRSHSAK